jgi:hypothetical protein
MQCPEPVDGEFNQSFGGLSAQSAIHCARLCATSPKRQRRHCFRLRTIADAHCPCDCHESSHPIHKVGGQARTFSQDVPIGVAPQRQPRLCADGIGRGRDSESVLLVLGQPSRSTSIGGAVGERSLIGPVASERRRKPNATLSLGCRSSTVVTTSNARCPATYC